MAQAKHAPLYYATYRGPDPVAYVGDDPDRRGYPAGQTVQIGKPDADRIRRQKEHSFDLDRVADTVIGTAEEVHPDELVPLDQLQKKLAALTEGS